jgi:hypothetical protein
MDHFEVRKFTAIQRHLLLSCLSHTFLVEFCLQHGGKPAPNGVAGPHRDRRTGATVAHGRRCSRRLAESIPAGGFFSLSRPVS